VKYPILASITALLIIMSARSAAAQERLVDAKLTGVTVFRSSAREEQTVQTNLGSGQSEIIISDIPVSMNEKSLQVSVLGETDLISAQVRTNYIPDGNTAEQKTSTAIWLDSLRMLERRHRWIVEEKSVLQNELNLLDRLFAQVDASSGYSPSNVRESVSFYGSHSLDVRKKMFDLQLMEEELNDRRALLQQQMEENGEIKTRAVKEIILRFVSVKSVSIDLTVSYLVQAAGWLPFYDVRVKDTSSPVNLSAKARIFQSTGYDWQDVPVKISTMQPGIDNNRPLMSPAYIDYVTYRFNRVDNNSQFGVTNMMQVEHVDAKIKLTEKTDVPTTTLPDFSFDPGESDVMDEYNLKRLMTIRSDGKENIAELKEYTLPATYRYHSVPKLDASVFLIARITEFGPLNLLAGDANVFFDTKYIGQVQFNPRTIQDTLLVSLGRDDRILVKRVRTDAHVGKKLLSDKEEETFTYKTTVRNNKKEPIEIEILDQIPLSRKDEIKVEMISRDKAEYNKTFGKLMWTMKIDPGKSKSVEFSYSVQSPEGKPVEEIR
jgi:uncharacterized protein (TIGR02231 family)